MTYGLDFKDSPESESSRQSSLSPAPSRKRKESLELPLPPGALAPRKRAKTAVEKEQRRIERILRNRQAAQSSREKKRRQLEELEVINGNLETENRLTRDRLISVEEENKLLKRKLDLLSDQLDSMKQYMTRFEDFKFNVEAGREQDRASEQNEHTTLDYRIKTEPMDSLSVDSTLSAHSPSSIFDSSYASDSYTISELTTPSDAPSDMAFKEMHHPAAMVSCDLQRPLKFPQAWVPLTVRLATILVYSVITVSTLCYFTWQTRSPSTITTRSTSGRLVPTRSLSASQSLTGTWTPHRTRQIFRRLMRGLFQNQPRMRSLIGKSFRSTHQLSSQRSSRSRQMARAVYLTTVAATGPDSQWTPSHCSNNDAFLFSQLLGLSETWSVSVHNSDLSKLSRIVGSANAAVERNRIRIGREVAS